MQRFLERAKIQTKLIRQPWLGIEVYGIGVALNDRHKVAVMVKFMNPGNNNAAFKQRLPDKIGLAATCECLFGKLSRAIGCGDSRDKLDPAVCGERCQCDKAARYNASDSFHRVYVTMCE